MAGNRFSGVLLSALLVSFRVAWSGSAAARPVDDAQAEIVSATGKGENVLDASCSSLRTKNGKNVCFLKDFDSVVLIGNVNGRKADEVRTEYQALVTLGDWDAGTAAVGSEFIKPLPCTPSDKTFACGGFTEEKLTGTEVYWAGFQPDLVDRQKASECNSEGYATKVRKAYGDVTVAGRKSLHGFVQGHDENWRGELSRDVTSLGQIFAREKQAVIDLQAFVADDGNMSVFDAQGLSKNADFYTCWSKALATFGQLIIEDE